LVANAGCSRENVRAEARRSARPVVDVARQDFALADMVGDATHVIRTIPSTTSDGEAWIGRTDLAAFFFLLQLAADTATFSSFSARP
jgi:hypothetical protein